MTHLPHLLRRTPKIFYILSFLFAAASLAPSYWEISAITSPYAEPGNPVVRLTMAKAFYQALLEATYIIASGALIDIAIRIWDKMSIKEQVE
ncbi:MAG: hypothetical protein HC843_10850 [Sphingomonadales bacterium]|nr:hypothetical protein [Sphingomonadales bacterium]